MKKTVAFLFILFVLLQTSTMIAQDLLGSSDLSTLKVDNLLDADIVKIKTQLQANNVTINQVEPMALAKGMSSSEFAKLKVRLGATATNSVIKKDAVNSSVEYGRTQEKIVNVKVKDGANSLVFGSELFDNPTLNFEPNLKLATPVNYI
jgi:hypothetical protein